MGKRKKKKIKLVNRHKTRLKDRMVFSKVEAEMREQMERSITEAFPNPINRAHYISNLIKELEDEIARNETLDNVGNLKGVKNENGEEL